MADLIEAKEVIINEKIYVISKVPAIPGREIFTQYLPSAAPKIGDYKINEQLMLKLLSYVAVINEGSYLRLTTQALIDNHVANWETLMKIEAAMIEYNCSFFQNGRASTFLGGIAQKLPQWITKTLTDSLERLSQVDKPPSMN